MKFTFLLNSIFYFFKNSFLVIIFFPIFLSGLFYSLIDNKTDIDPYIFFSSFLYLSIFLFGIIIFAFRGYFHKERDYRNKRSLIAMWIRSHRGEEFRFRLKDIMEYSARHSDRTTLKHTPSEPPILVSGREALRIVADLAKRGLLKVYISANRVEEFMVDDSGKQIYWNRFRKKNLNDIIIEPFRFVGEKFSWFVLTFISSSFTIYLKYIFSKLFIYLGIN